jgi:sugar lactone lactonase YvrE
MALSFERISDLALGIGEGPVWDDARGRLWFVDIAAPALFEFDPVSRATRVHGLPHAIGSAALSDGGWLVLALRTGVHIYDPETRRLDLLVQPEPDHPTGRLNDGKAGPDGAFWVGSMSERQPYEPTGALYRVAGDGSVRMIRGGLHVSNGLEWSPDGTVMYHADSVPGEIVRFAFDPATGELGSCAPFFRCDGLVGHPDGAAMDREGCYWSAGVTAGRLNRISPAGDLLESIVLPCVAPTMPCFGGEDLRTIFLTSLARDGESGGLYAARADVSGLPPFRFRL